MTVGELYNAWLDLIRRGQDNDDVRIEYQYGLGTTHNVRLESKHIKSGAQNVVFDITSAGQTLAGVAPVEHRVCIEVIVKREDQ